MRDVPLQRRDFLFKASVAVGGLLGAGWLADDAIARPGARGLRASRREYARHVGSTFRFSARGVGEALMRLEETQGIGLTSAEHARRSRRQPFSAFFRLKRGTALPQGTYHVWHARLGRFELFIVPVGPEAGIYEAVLQ